MTFPCKSCFVPTLKIFGVSIFLKLVVDKEIADLPWNNPENPNESDWAAALSTKTAAASAAGPQTDTLHL